MQRKSSFRRTFRCNSHTFLFRTRTKIIKKWKQDYLFYASIYFASKTWFSWKYICHSGTGPELPSLADISPDHPLLTQPHWNETFSVGRFTALCVWRVAKTRLANKPRKSSLSVNSVFDGPSAVGNSRREDGTRHSWYSCKILWSYANLLKAFKWGLWWIEIHFKAQLF